MSASGGRLSRRRFLAEAAIMGAGALALPASASAKRRRRKPPGRNVAVFGAGVAGLTAAHELAERGFDVTVYERRAWGGKARSTEVPSSATGGRRPLPGEHGFRVVFGFYQNLPDTMQRIPFGPNPRGVFDNLVTAPQLSFARVDERPLVLPLGAPDPRPYTPVEIQDLLLGLLLQTDIPPQAIAHFVNRMIVFLSSCDARRLGEWEEISWKDFIGSTQYTADYRKLLAESLTRLLQASQPDGTSANCVGWILEALIYNTLGRGCTGSFDRVLNLPTNEAWIHPWLHLLETLGVRLKIGHTLHRLELERGRISRAIVNGPEGRYEVRADWYVCALPLDRARALWTHQILDADPQLAAMAKLQTGWMNGIQFYLRARSPIVKGHVGYLDSPWALTSVSQAQFWPLDFATTYGDGQVRDCLSVDIADWSTPGIIYRKPARNCSPAEVAHEVWEQIKQHLNNTETTITDDLLLSWNLDPGLIARHGRFDNEDPVVINSVGALTNRPTAATTIHNLVLAGDYVKSDWVTQCMEAANASGRLATNTLLERSGSHQPTCNITPHYRPPEWEPLKQIDASRYRQGQPNVFDTPGLATNPGRLRQTLRRLTRPVI